MTWTVRFHPAVFERDLPAIPANLRIRIINAIETRLGVAPDRLGKPLRVGLAGFRRLRVGDWRVIYSVEGRVVMILIIGHRSEVYDSVALRLGPGS